MRLIFLFIFSQFFIVIHGIGQGVVINEVMSKNNSTIQDEDGDYSDWIELYNNSSAPVNIENYGITDDLSDLGKWIFPNIEIPPHGYLIVFASNKDRSESSELHTNFNLSSNGEDLILTNSNGAFVDEMEFYELYADEAFARVPDASPNWIIIDRPSPSFTNNNSNKLNFSHPVGFYTEPFDLIIDSTLPDTIYYTLNGDIPDTTSLFMVGPLHIDFKDSLPNIFSEIQTTAAQDLISYPAWQAPSETLDKATILRCTSFRNGIQTSNIYTKSFFVAPNIYTKYAMPIVSLITEGENFFNNDTGIYVPGIHFNANFPLSSGNYSQHGEDWERDVHIEYFDVNGSLGFAQDAGVRIHGGQTRIAAQKSLRLYARKEYGTQYFNYKLLPQNNVDEYKRFILRTTMGGWNSETIFKDALGQNISRSLNLESQDYKPVLVFLNGEFWGIHTLRDYLDENYISYTRNAIKDSVVLFEEGNNHYESLESFIENNDLEYLDNYTYVKTQIDIDNYIDYTIAEQFFINYDWPANNMKLWRELPDGKWRWILYDLDAGFGEPYHSMLSHSTANDSTVSWPNSPQSTFLFRNLLKNDSFRAHFIERYAEILCDNFNPELTTEKYHAIKKLYEPEIQNQITRWHYPNSLSDWEEDIESTLLNFLVERPDYVRENLTSFFGLEKYDFACVSVEPFELETSFNMYPNPSDGHFNIYNRIEDFSNISLTIHSIDGSIIQSEYNFAFEINGAKSFDLSYLQSGTYILKLSSVTYSETIKIVVIH